jgi:hypothetical protein
MNKLQVAEARRREAVSNLEGPEGQGALDTLQAEVGPDRGSHSMCVTD